MYLHRGQVGKLRGLGCSRRCFSVSMAAVVASRSVSCERLLLFLGVLVQGGRWWGCAGEFSKQLQCATRKQNQQTAPKCFLSELARLGWLVCWRT